MCLLPVHCLIVCCKASLVACTVFQTPTANISSLFDFINAPPACRWIWLLCRSSFQRWPSDTRASPAPAHVRMGSQEGWVPLASWTTAWQRRAWTDRGKQHESFVKDTKCWDNETSEDKLTLWTASQALSAAHDYRTQEWLWLEKEIWKFCYINHWKCCRMHPGYKLWKHSNHLWSHEKGVHHIKDINKNRMTHATACLAPKIFPD